jgi:rhodanese-related sulfurtransferase
MDTSKIKPGLMVHVLGTGEMGGVPGQHVGTVDHMEGNQCIKLAAGDSDEGKHRWIPMDMVSHVDDKAVYLNCTLDGFNSRVSYSPPEEGKQGGGIRTISYQELQNKMSGDKPPQVVNVLEPQHYHLGSIQGSLKIPVSEIESRANELDRSREVVTYCAGYQCPASRQAAEKLAAKGFNVSAYEGGIEEWKKSGLPTEAEQKAA